jgi:hypothetical protein
MGVVRRDDVLVDLLHDAGGVPEPSSHDLAGIRALSAAVAKLCRNP